MDNPHHKLMEKLSPIPAAVKSDETKSASPGGSFFDGNGLFWVLNIKASISLSKYIFKPVVPETASVIAAMKVNRINGLMLSPAAIRYPKIPEKQVKRVVSF